MADRKKVIKGLAICSTPICRTDCPYDNGKVSGCIVTLMKDALELLKAQEPVEPIRNDIGIGYWHQCGACGTALGVDWKYCHNCGRMVKTDE